MRASAGHRYAMAAGLLVLVAATLASCTLGRTEPTPKGAGTMQLTSTGFSDGAPIPAKYATTAVPGGMNVSIPLAWAGAGSDVRSFTVIFDDRAPAARGWIHWLVVDIPADVTSLAEGASGRSMPKGARELTNGFGRVGYDGPQPPPGTGLHAYVATVYALDVPSLDVRTNASADDVRRAMQGQILAEASYRGTMRR